MTIKIGKLEISFNNPRIAMPFVIQYGKDWMFYIQVRFRNHRRETRKYNELIANKFRRDFIKHE